MLVVELVYPKNETVFTKYPVGQAKKCYFPGNRHNLPPSLKHFFFGSVEFLSKDRNFPGRSFPNSTFFPGLFQEPLDQEPGLFQEPLDQLLGFYINYTHSIAFFILNKMQKTRKQTKKNKNKNKNKTKNKKMKFPNCLKKLESI